MYLLTCNTACIELIDEAGWLRRMLLLLKPLEMLVT